MPAPALPVDPDAPARIVIIERRRGYLIGLTDGAATWERSLHPAARDALAAVNRLITRGHAPAFQSALTDLARAAGLAAAPLFVIPHHPARRQR